MTSPRYYTATMANLYAQQGYLRKAAHIYSYLLKKEPHRLSLRLALEKIELDIEKQKGPTKKELGLLLREWVDLMNKQKQSRKKGQ